MSAPGLANSQQDVKVLHIAGLHGTGSTILANVLGALDGFFAAGELAYLWQALERREVCTCGRELRQCDVWRRALDSVFATPAEAIAGLRPEASWVNASNLPLLALQERRGDRQLERYRTLLADVCRAIRATTGARVIVEASKHPPYGRVLARIPGVKSYVVHLVRDPRASACSWTRARGLAARPAVVGGIWTTWHWTIPRLWSDQRKNYLALRYEDFVRAPRRAVLDILALVEEPNGELPFVDEHTVRLGPSHMANGNPTRFRTGIVELRDHNEWRGRLSARQAWATTATTWPLLRRWGYPLRVDGAMRTPRPTRKGASPP